MKFSPAAVSIIVVAYIALAGCGKGEAVVSDVPNCSGERPVGYWPSRAELNQHRQFSLPTLTYPYDTKLEPTWGFALLLEVDASGSVTCYGLQGRYGRDVELNQQRRRLLAELRQWRYQPFLEDGKPVAAAIREQIDEAETPAAKRPLPTVPLEQVQISLERTMCFGECPDYTVDVYGDGRVVYKGDHYVDVVGEHTYRIPPARVAELVEIAVPELCAETVDARGQRSSVGFGYACSHL